MKSTKELSEIEKAFMDSAIYGLGQIKVVHVDPDYKEHWLSKMLRQLADWIES